MIIHRIRYGEYDLLKALDIYRDELDIYRDELDVF
jgi:hypothetical protein